MRQAAVPLFVAAWIAHAMLTIYDVATAVSGRHYLAVPIIGLIAFGAFTAIVAYVLSLQRRGFLRPGA